jgi:hypothetical protein
MEEKHGPYATREDIQVLRGDLLERLGTMETRLSDRISNATDRIIKVEGQVTILARLNYMVAASLLAMAIKVVFF